MANELTNIIVVTELYYPEETSTGYFLTKIAEGLANYYSVAVVCVQPTYSSRGTRAPKYERLRGVDVYRCKATALNKDNLLFKIINTLSISISIFVHLLINLSSKQRVLVVTNPPVLPYLTAIACLIKRAGYILLVHDVYPEVLIATRIISPEGLIAKLGGWIAMKLYQNCQKIVVLGRDMKALVIKKIGQQRSDKIVIISNWSDIDLVYPLPHAEKPFLASMKLTDKFVILYSGNMGRTHGIENILKTALQLTLDEGIHFLFCGSGAKRPWLESTLKNESLPNVSLISSQPRAELQNLLNSCDIAIISFMSGMAGVSVPSRMYNILAAGKPIIAVADSSSELALVVLEESVGWVVPPDQPDKLREAILFARSNPELLDRMGRKARSVAEVKYTLNQVINEYQALLADMPIDS
jgi:colanic acid biosynthesis glycosyl transferase WcaI